MSLTRTLEVLRKDVFMSPRSSIFFFALAMPIILTVMFQLVFGSLFDPEPRLGIVDHGDSEITVAARARTSSIAHGFRFCGMMDDPVQNSSGSEK